jgi:hypothetical protein
MELLVHQAEEGERGRPGVSVHRVDADTGRPRAHWSPERLKGVLIRWRSGLSVHLCDDLEFEFAREGGEGGFGDRRSGIGEGREVAGLVHTSHRDSSVGLSGRQAGEE